MPRLVIAPEAALGPVVDSTRRFPLLTVWAAGQLRQGQTVVRVLARLRRSEVGIDELLEASLLEATEGLTDDERRYTLHPITRAFVRRRLPLDSGGEWRAIHQAGFHYCRMAEAFAGSGRQWPSFDRVEPEIQNICALTGELSRLATDGDGDPPGFHFDTCLVTLAHELRNFFWLRHYWREGLDFFHRAIDAARRLGDAHAVGWTTYSATFFAAPRLLERPRTCLNA